MFNILVIQSSISGQESISRALVNETVTRLLEANPGAKVVVRTLVPIPCHTWTRTIWLVCAVLP